MAPISAQRPEEGEMDKPDGGPKDAELRERRIWRSALRLCLKHRLDCTCAGCCDIYAALEAWCVKGEGP